ncbi:hypothetical protein GFS24_27355 [Chitinophaga sp. SYP-B3965]|uniref:hypothetical protein n=1 Tax=Chitinophaga sp. SYP-B3965 TaxID=2663120 RepID=UPI001299DC89|nr:hypothetical protein [Chitinophaga sp. SYP-B3965]MRG48858.1 hypothetical protein [Chitinophaga sp. SYP-B3965]
MKIRLPIIPSLLACCAVAIIFLACHKEQIPGKEKTSSQSALTIKEARSYFYKTIRPSMERTKNSSTHKLGKLYAFFDRAELFDAGDYQVIEVPATWEHPQLVTIRMGAPGDTNKRAQPDKTELGNVDRLVIHRLKDGTMQQKIVSYVPDKEYMGRHKYDASHNRLWSLDKDFSGFLIHRQLNGDPYLAFKVKGGKIVAKLDYQKVRKPDANAKWVNKCEIVSFTETWIQMCEVKVVDNPSAGGYEYIETCFGAWEVVFTQECSEVWVEDTSPCSLNPYSVGCPGITTPPGTDPQVPEEVQGPHYPVIAINPGEYPISDPSDYFAAFNTSQPARISICTKQPVPGARTADLGGDIGHTFFTIEQNIGGHVVRRSFGLYPTLSVNNLISTRPANLGQEIDRFYDAELVIFASSSEFADILDLITSAAGGSFTLNGGNSHHLAIVVARSVGIMIPFTNGSLSMGGAAINGGDLGEDLKLFGGYGVPLYTTNAPDLN